MIIPDKITQYKISQNINNSEKDVIEIISKYSGEDLHTLLVNEGY